MRWTDTDTSKWSDGTNVGSWTPFANSSSQTHFMRVTIGGDGLWYTYNSTVINSVTAAHTAAFWCMTEPVCESYSE